jgi:hypothetical protein
MANQSKEPENCHCPYTEDGSALCIENDGIIECDGSCYHSAEAESQNEARLERQAEEKMNDVLRSHHNMRARL